MRERWKCDYRARQRCDLASELEQMPAGTKIAITREGQINILSYGASASIDYEKEDERSTSASRSTSSGTSSGASSPAFAGSTEAAASATLGASAQVEAKLELGIDLSNCIVLEKDTKGMCHLQIGAGLGLTASATASASATFSAGASGNISAGAASTRAGDTAGGVAAEASLEASAGFAASAELRAQAQATVEVDFDVLQCARFLDKFIMHEVSARDLNQARLAMEVAASASANASAEVSLQASAQAGLSLDTAPPPVVTESQEYLAALQDGFKDKVANLLGADSDDEEEHNTHVCEKTDESGNVIARMTFTLDEQNQITQIVHENLLTNETTTTTPVATESTTLTLSNLVLGDDSDEAADDEANADTDAGAAAGSSLPSVSYQVECQANLAAGAQAGISYHYSDNSNTIVQERHYEATATFSAAASINVAGPRVDGAEAEASVKFKVGINNTYRHEYGKASHLTQSATMDTECLFDSEDQATFKAKQFALCCASKGMRPEQISSLVQALRDEELNPSSIVFHSVYQYPAPAGTAGASAGTAGTPPGTASAAAGTASVPAGAAGYNLTSSQVTNPHNYAVESLDITIGSTEEQQKKIGGVNVTKTTTQSRTFSINLSHIEQGAAAIKAALAMPSKQVDGERIRNAVI